MSEPTAYLATVVYEDKAGATRHIGAVVLAVDAADAIEAAIAAVRGLPQCASIIGGVLEPCEPEELAPEPEADTRTKPIARNSAGQTVH